MVEEEFVEEFFLNAVKAKKEKETARKSKLSKKEKKKKQKKKTAELQKITEEILKPEKTPSKTPIEKPLALSEDFPPDFTDEDSLEPPAPPKHILDLEPPAPPGHLVLPIPPKFFETETKSALKPIIDLGKINKFITDPSVESIQCDGSFMPLKIVRNNQEINIGIELDEREINDIINKFAEVSQKQAKGPIFKASVKGLSISAVISEFAGTKFVITKK